MKDRSCPSISPFNARMQSLMFFPESISNFNRKQPISLSESFKNYKAYSHITGISPHFPVLFLSEINILIVQKKKKRVEVWDIISHCVFHFVLNFRGSTWHLEFSFVLPYCPSLSASPSPSLVSRSMTASPFLQSFTLHLATASLPWYPNVPLTQYFCRHLIKKRF